MNNHLMDQTNALLYAESQKKSKFIAFLLNLFFPGIGQYYAREWIGGTIYLVVLFTAYNQSMAGGVIVNLGLAALGAITGPVSVAFYNKDMLRRLIRDRERQRLAVESPDVSSAMDGLSSWDVLGDSQKKAIFWILFALVGIILFLWSLLT